MKGNTITQGHTDNRIMNIKPDSAEVQRNRMKIAPVFCTVPLKLHYCSLINNSFLFIDFSLLLAGFNGRGLRQWDYTQYSGGGGIMVCWGSTPSENAVGWSCVWLHRLISAITAQLDWPDILASFVSGIIHLMKASYRQLLLQQSFSILGVWGSVWRAASCLSSGEWENWCSLLWKLFLFCGAAGNVSGSTSS